jgi:hypothetical protein
MLAVVIDLCLDPRMFKVDLWSTNQSLKFIINLQKGSEFLEQRWLQDVSAQETEETNIGQLRTMKFFPWLHCCNTTAKMLFCTLSIIILIWHNFFRCHVKNPFLRFWSGMQITMHMQWAMNGKRFWISSPKLSLSWIWASVWVIMG